MSRSHGSISTAETKKIASEINQIIETPYKYNLSILRMIEILICQRISEQVCEFDSDTKLEDRVVKVEIPLIGILTIKPSTFHKNHRLTDESSVHFEFKFKPTSCFKSDIILAYKERTSELADNFLSIYSERINDLYDSLKGGEDNEHIYRNTKIG